ncbi:MAG: phage portal protein [Aggregatilineales bacterium]
MLDKVAGILGDVVRDTWAADTQQWGERVRLFRDYADGNHRAKMTDPMKELLRIADATEEQFNANYCDMIVQTMADRLVVEKIAGAQDTDTVWADELRQENRFDALQIDVHEATVRDGDTFIMLAFDNESKRTVWEHEPAYDGEVGMIAVYDRMRRNMVAAVKIWWEAGFKTRRVNVYFADRIMKYSEGEQSLTAIDSEFAEGYEWNSLVGVPVVHFRNRGRANKERGLSELADAVPLQDALNRTLVSMVITAELTAFQIRYAIGFPPPDKTTPGMWIAAGEEGVTKDQVVEVGVLEQGQIMPFIQQAQHLEGQMGTITRTPLPNFMGGDNASGEALKQRESYLLAKVKKFQVKGGNAWEDVMALSVRMTRVYGVDGGAPAEGTRWNTQWKDAQMRNDTEVVDNALKVADRVGNKEFLRLIAPVFNYDEQRLTKIEMEKAEETTQALSQLPLPGFGEFGGSGVDVDPVVDDAAA